MIEFRMPSLGADMEAGTLVEWVKKPGDAVHRGDIIAVVDTEKGAIEVEVFDDGVLDRTAVQPGAKVPVGTVLALIRGVDEPAGVAPPAAEPAPLPAAAPAEARPAEPAPAPAAAPAARRIAPAARKAAGELGVDLSGVEGTGPGGSVTRADVERVARAPAAPAPRAAAPAAGMRAAIAAAMARSKREIPHLYLGTSIDMTRPLAWLTAQNETRRVADRLLPIVLLLKAVALAARDVPEINGFWVDQAFRSGGGVHVGCAIALRDGGLVAPALHDVDRKDLETVMQDLRDLIARTRAGSLRSSELADGTITVTNLGDLGVETAFGIIYPSQVAIVGFGRVAPRPWVVDDRVEPRPLVTATVSADHRAVDGRRAGQFLGAIERRLQQPEEL